MHFMPDTEDEDSAAETFWPEGYKQITREDVRQLAGTRFGDGKVLKHIYQRQYSERYGDLSQFIGKIADMVAIGAENGADDAFDDIISAFLTESPLPEERRHAHYFRPQAFSNEIKGKLRQVILDEYSQDNIYTHAYKVGYQPTYHNFDEFLGQVAELVTAGAMNGADDMLEAVYGAFFTSHPLPPARRHPRRLKTW